MTVKEFKAELATMADDDLVVIDNGDHGYHTIDSLYVGKAEVVGEELFEYDCEENMQDPANKIVTILIVN